ncbi:hypothetical protein AA0522_2434 [Gluconacetobacter liquefaciens NRIC 0522]|nr:hypothetical protein AA0522_2434 [Gluconacetobacter liquefaciens NRIC 0522]
MRAPQQPAPPGHDDLAAMARQQADRRLVDLWGDHLLGAAVEKGHPPDPWCFRRE